MSGVAVTHGERVVDRTSGHTKLDLVHHYERVAAFMLPHLKGRPVALLRAPGGVGEPVFFQKHVSKGGLPGVRELDAALWPGHEPLFEIDSVEALHNAAQMNAIEFHTWNSRRQALLKPDRLVFDLDPGEGVAWTAIREAAQLVRAFLLELELQSWLKTSGGKGLHLVVPIAARWDFATTRGFAKAVVDKLAETLPQHFVARSGAEHRQGRIFVDYLRNGEGATTVAAFSARARPGLGVSMPVAWDELPEVSGAAEWTIANAHERLAAQRSDPWAAMAGVRQSLTPGMRALRWQRARDEP